MSKISGAVFGVAHAAQIRTVVVLIICGVALMVLRAEGAMEQHFIYFPARDIVITPDRYDLAFEEVLFRADDGVQLHGWYVPGDSGQPLVLFFHGNAGNISHRVENIWYLNRLGLGVFIFDYRGYGKSAGQASEEGLTRDALAARQWLLGKGIPPGQVIYFGRSLGAAVAVALAQEAPPAGLVLETPFTSIRALGRRHYPLLHFGLGWLIRDRYDSLAKIAELRVPLLVFQGDSDSIVPESMARELFEAANEPKSFHLIRGADHNNTYERGGGSYWRAWEEFIVGLAAKAAESPPTASPPGAESPTR